MKWNQHLPQARLLVLRHCFVCFISIILEGNLRICMQNTETNQLSGSSETSETTSRKIDIQEGSRGKGQVTKSRRI